jgi:hypothetical protein
MNRGKIIQTILFLLISLSCFASESLPLDTLLIRVMNAAEKYNDLVESYSAEVYTRSYVETKEKNFLYKYTHLIPQFVIHDPHNDNALIETMYRILNTFQELYQVKKILSQFHLNL